MFVVDSPLCKSGCKYARALSSPETSLCRPHEDNATAVKVSKLNLIIVFMLPDAQCRLTKKAGPRLPRGVNRASRMAGAKTLWRRRLGGQPGLFVFDHGPGDGGRVTIENISPEPVLLDHRIQQRITALALHGHVIGVDKAFILSDRNKIKKHDAGRLAFALAQLLVIRRRHRWDFERLGDAARREQRQEAEGYEGCFFHFIFHLLLFVVVDQNVHRLIKKLSRRVLAAGRRPPSGIGSGGSFGGDFTFMILRSHQSVKIIAVGCREYQVII